MLNLIFLHLSRFAKTSKVLVPMFLMPLIVISGLMFIFTDASKSVDYMIVNHDSGSHSSILIDKLSEGHSKKPKITSISKAKELISKKKYTMAYIIPKNFSDSIDNMSVPEIEILIPEGSTVASSIEIDGIVNDMFLLRSMVKSGEIEKFDFEYLPEMKYSLESDSDSVINSFKNFFMIAIFFNFVLFSSVHAATELNDLKNEKILMRSITTPNSNLKILGSLILALFLVQFISFSISFLILNTIFEGTYSGKLHTIIIFIAGNSLLSMCYGVFITRISSNKATITTLCNIPITVTCYLAGSFTPKEMMPSALLKFSKFFPQYWSNNGALTGNLFPNILIVLLFAALFFTAGSVSLRKIARS